MLDFTSDNKIAKNGIVAYIPSIGKLNCATVVYDRQLGTIVSISMVEKHWCETLWLSSGGYNYDLLLCKEGFFIFERLHPNPPKIKQVHPAKVEAEWTANCPKELQIKICDRSNNVHFDFAPSQNIVEHWLKILNESGDKDAKFAEQWLTKYWKKSPYGTISKKFWLLYLEALIY